MLARDGWRRTTVSKLLSWWHKTYADAKASGEVWLLWAAVLYLPVLFAVPFVRGWLGLR